MKLRDDRTSRATSESNRRYEVIEMHSFDENASQEVAFCGAASETDRLTGVSSYLEDRLYGKFDYVICEGCKPWAVPFAVRRIRDLEAEGRWDEADEYRLLAATLLQETGLAPNSG